VKKPVILLVDDDSDTLDLFEVFLYEYFEVHTAPNGFEGLNRAKKIKPDCIITDIMMPVMDGIRFIKRIRTTEGISNVPIIAVTAFSTTLQERSLTNIGFESVVAKPISRRVLLETINSILGVKNEK